MHLFVCENNLNFPFGILSGTEHKLSAGVYAYCRAGAHRRGNLFDYRGDRRGALAITLAGKTVQAVAMGVVLTAVIQAAVAGLGLFVCQIPSSALLTGIIFMLCLMQLGPTIVMIPAAVWLLYTGYHWTGGLLLIWSFVAGSLDNILKPMLIKRGADTSLLLIMAGVIGGMLTWGMIGLMIGPVLLAVSWKLLATWVNDTTSASTFNAQTL